VATPDHFDSVFYGVDDMRRRSHPADADLRSIPGIDGVWGRRDRGGGRGVARNVT